MNPIPAGTHPSSMPDDRPAFPFSSPLPVAQQSHPAAANRSRYRTPLVYPLLLLTSTALAAAFCYLYITKPFISRPSPPLALPAVATASSAVPVAQITVAPPAAAGAPAAALLPNANHLPGDALAAKPPGRPEQASPRQAIPGNTAATAFEETNLRIQHVLTAETPGGDVSRIVLDVPVLYQSGTLAWTQTDLAEARELLKNLTAYQEKARELRDEGSRLLAAWNHLVERAIPTTILRADSPALPGNQQAGAENPKPETLDTSESIQLQPAGK